MPEAHENLVLDSEHSIVSLPMSSSQTEVLLPVTTQSLFDTQTDTAIFSSISNFQDETPCPPSDENEVPPEFDESLIDMLEHDIQQFIDGQQSKNTIKKTLRDVDFVEKSCPFEKGREGHSFDSSKWIRHAPANFLLTVRKKMEVISSHAPCAVALVVVTGSYDEHNIGTQSLPHLAQEWKMYHSTWHGKLWKQNKSSFNRAKAINQRGHAL